MRELLTAETAVLLAILIAGAVATRGDDRRLALLWAVLLPIDQVRGIAPEVFDVLRYGGAIFLVARVRASRPGPTDRTTTLLAALILVLGAVRAVTGVIHGDGSSIRYGLVMGAGAVIALLVVRRRSLLPALIVGYVSGLALSAAVSLTQATGLPTLAPGNVDGSRYPGLASYTTWFTWQMAVGLVLAVHLVITDRGTSPARTWMPRALVVLFALGLLTNGAQGGLLGVVVAAGAVAVTQRRHLTTRVVSVAAAAVAGLAAVAVVAAVGLGMEVPTVSDYLDGGFENEAARLETFDEGIATLTDHPLIGVPSEEYVERHELVPHFLPIEAGAFAGVAGLLAAAAVVLAVGAVVVRGPASHRAVNVTGHALLTAMCASFLTGPQGPVLGLARTLPLMVAVHCARDRWPFADAGRPTHDDASGDQTSAPAASGRTEGSDDDETT